MDKQLKNNERNSLYMDIENEFNNNFNIEEINFISNNNEKTSHSLDDDIDEKVLNLFLQNNQNCTPIIRQHKENSIVNSIIENSKHSQVVPLTLRKRLLYQNSLKQTS